MTENQSYLDKYGRFNASQAWQEGKVPIVRFVTDDEKVVGIMFAHITRTYEDQIVKALMVSGPAGVVIVRGPEVAAYHNKLAQGLADLGDIPTKVRKTPRDCRHWHSPVHTRSVRR
jgi:hypothetical protein